MVYDGVFDSGLAAILDVLGQRRHRAGRANPPGRPAWDVMMVGVRPRRCGPGAGHVVGAKAA